ncbi:TonB-dependent receptor (plasmid) [Cereibacter azotoformans]|uniref:GntR domain protein n=1 Tax=Cereibacter sphaeroides (strain ATCC 17025 / ATH 2.4.3) TaxID=349102 RepID=A4X0F1_CERS5|nr:TonB-dependent receptor [Cereibacter azotoformans]ULB12614.1 TonB-dependent receptor [Cereibacter azotoformans]
MSPLSSRMIRLLAGSAAAFGPSTAALAQDLAFSLDPIVVQSRDEFAEAADRATSMYVADAELERARTGDLKDVFAGIASVSVGGALPLTQKIFVNGVDMLNLGVSIDGAAQNNRAFHHVSANAIDPGLLKQVRVDATISPADAGPYALAGSVVFETVDAADILAEGQSFGGNLRLSYGDNGQTAQGALTLAGREGGFEWLAYGKRATGEDYEDGDGETRLGTAANLTSVLGKLAYEAPEGHRVELSALRLRDDELRQFRANFGGLNGVEDSLRRYDTTRESWSLSYENTQAGGLWDPSVRLGYSESDIVIPEPYDSNGLSGTWSATLQNDFHLNATDRISAGIDWQRRFGEYSSPTYGEFLEETSHNIGLFAQARLEPTERWRLSFGGRFDRQDFEGVDGSDERHSGGSGNLSASYALTESLTLRGGLSSIFGGVDIEDNYIFDPGWSYADLRPSRAQNASLGFDWDGGALKLGGELFLTEIDRARSASENFDFESRGFNLGATYGWEGGFARFTLSHSDVKVDGEKAAGYEALDFGAPLGTVAAFEVQQDTTLPGLRLGGGLDLALDHDMPDTADFDLEGYSVVNVFAEYVPPQAQNLTLRLQVDNLFDTTFADRATYGAEYGTVTSLKEPGRTITLSAVTRF